MKASVVWWERRIPVAEWNWIFRGERGEGGGRKTPCFYDLKVFVPAAN